MQALMMRRSGMGGARPGNTAGRQQALRCRAATETRPSDLSSASNADTQAHSTLAALDAILGTPPPQPEVLRPPSTPAPVNRAGQLGTPASRNNKEVQEGRKVLESIFAFDGLAPEVINGRAAMLGFVIALQQELTTGTSIFAQIIAGGGAARGATVIALVIVASFAPAVRKVLGDKSLTWPGIFAKDPKMPAVFGPFDANTELINGRAAMIGLAALWFLEAGSAYAFFS